MNRIFCISCLTLFLALGCTTMESIQSGEPSYVINYSGVDVAAVQQCAQAKFDEKSSYTFVPRDMGEYFVLEAYAGNVAVVPGVAAVPTSVPYFATRFYDDRVEIYGRFNIAGDYGKSFIPYIEECISELGGFKSD